MTGATGGNDKLKPLADDATEIRTAFDQIPLIAISTVDAEYRITAANSASRVFFGRSDLVGLLVREVIPDAGDQKVADLLARVYATGRAETAPGWRIPLTAHEHGRAEALVDLTVLQWRSATGSIGLIAAGTDATASARAREEAQLHADDTEHRRAARSALVSLREAVLPTGLPVLPGASIAARYLIARQEKPDGGDWFDAIPVAGGVVALVVGNVLGHGVGAAATIAQVRAVLTELLLDHADLRAVLTRIDGLAARTPSLQAATMALVLLSPGDGTLHYITCGHPAPLIISDSTSRFLPATGGSPLGTASLRTVASDTLNPGDLLLLYSKGLVERAGRTLTVGLTELARAAASAASGRVRAGVPAASAADRLCQLTVELMAKSGYADAVTTLAAERLPAPMPPALHLELPAVAASLTTIRRALREWLVRLGPSDEDQDGVHMAVVETVTNAIEHAYPRGQPGPLEFDLALRPDGQLECLVSDYGGWQSPDPAAAYRGNGLMVAEQMIDRLLISHPADADDAQPGAASTVVRLLHRLSRPAGVVSGVTSDPYRLRAGPAFAVEARLDGAGARARVRGAVDVTTADDFLRKLLAACRGGTLPLTVDLTDVTYLADAGVSALFRLAGQLRDSQNRLELIPAAESQVRDVLELVGMAYREAAPPTRADA